MSQEDFYIIFKLIDGKVTGHSIKRGEIKSEEISGLFSRGSSKDDKDGKAKSQVQGEDQQASETSQSLYPENFSAVERSFNQAILMYQKSVVEVIKVSPLIAFAFADNNIQSVARERGTKREDLSSDDVHVYSLPKHAAYKINRHVNQSEALIEGAMHLTKISVIGIISSFDAILTDLLKVIFRLKPEIIMTSDREIKFSDLIEFESIDAARESIISQEIEGAIRQSHHEQFNWMEKKFSIKLREGLDVWPEFVELCERRNLLTHTGGVISKQYLKNCEVHGKKSDRKIGDKLDVDIEYLKSAIEIVSEVGFKLIHTLWRKFSPGQRGDADSALNALGMDLIANRQYSLAEKILKFGVDQKQHHSELIKRMMVVNLANAAKLGGHRDRCDKALASHDWSATSYKFQICVAAVRNDFAEVVRLMKLGGEVVDLNPSNFRDWPVFRDARKDAGVQKAFEQVFGESLNIASEKTISSDSISDEVMDEEQAPEGKAIH